MTKQEVHTPTKAGTPPAFNLSEPCTTRGAKDMVLALTALTSALSLALRSETQNLDDLIQLCGQAQSLRRATCGDPDLTCDHEFRRAMIVLNGKIQALRSRIIIEETRAAWPDPVPR